MITVRDDGYHFSDQPKTDFLILQIMRGLLLIFLLLCLPFQSSWVLASTYCKHETGSAAKHLGHHSHQHRTASDPSSDGPLPTTKHQDCESCHQHFSDMVWLGSSLTIPLLGFLPEFLVFFDLQFLFQDGPDKPNWRSVG